MNAAAAYWIGYLRAHPTWAIVFAACEAAVILTAYLIIRLTDDHGEGGHAAPPPAKDDGDRYARQLRSLSGRHPGWAWHELSARITALHVITNSGAVNPGSTGPLSVDAAPVAAPDAPGPASLPSGNGAPGGLTAAAVPAAGPGTPACDCLIENPGPRTGGAIRGCPVHDIGRPPWELFTGRAAPATTTAGAWQPRTDVPGPVAAGDTGAAPDAGSATPEPAAPQPPGQRLQAAGPGDCPDCTEPLKPCPAGQDCWNLKWKMCRGIVHLDGGHTCPGGQGRLLSIGDYGDTDTPFATPAEVRAELRAEGLVP